MKIDVGRSEECTHPLLILYQNFQKKKTSKSMDINSKLVVSENFDFTLHYKKGIYEWSFGQLFGLI